MLAVSSVFVLVICCLLHTLYFINLHFCVSYLVPTNYYADDADRAIQYATEAASQKVEGEAASGSSTAAKQPLEHEDSKPASKSVSEPVAFDCSNDDEPTVVSCLTLCITI